MKLRKCGTAESVGVHHDVNVSSQCAADEYQTLLFFILCRAPDAITMILCPIRLAHRSTPVFTVAKTIPRSPAARLICGLDICARICAQPYTTKQTLLQRTERHVFLQGLERLYQYHFSQKHPLVAFGKHAHAKRNDTYYWWILHAGQGRAVRDEMSPPWRGCFRRDVVCEIMQATLCLLA